jgi:hypothetical protein
LIAISRQNSSGGRGFGVAGKALLSRRRPGHAAAHQSPQPSPDSSLLLVSNEELPTPLLIGCLLATHLIIVLDPLWVLSRISGNMSRDVTAINESEWHF